MLFSPQLISRGARSAAGGGGSYTQPPGTWIGQWDASLTSSLTLGAGSAVTNWVDASGNGNDLGDGSTSSKPVYAATGGPSSKPILTFSSGHRLFVTSSTFPMGTGNTLTFFWVGSMNSATDAYGMPIIYPGSGTVADIGTWYFSRENTNQQFRFNRNASAVSPAMVYDTTYRVIGTIDSGGAMTLYIDGVATTGATQAGNWIDNGQFALGETPTNPGLRRFAGTMSHVGVSAAFTNSTDVATLDAFLQTKWAL